MAPWAAARSIIVAAVSSSLKAKQPSSTASSRSSQLCFGLEAMRHRWASQYSLSTSSITSESGEPILANIANDVFKNWHCWTISP
eukprot:2431431-Amphidinium_carterae.1